MLTHFTSIFYFLPPETFRFSNLFFVCVCVCVCVCGGGGGGGEGGGMEMGNWREMG